MKRLAKSQNRDFGPLKIDAYALRELYSIFSAADGTRLIADNIEFDSIDELLGEYSGRKPRDLEIRAREPYLSLKLTPRSASLYSGDSDLKATGIFAQAANLLVAHERTPRFLFKDSRLFLIFITLQITLLIPQLKPYKFFSVMLMGTLLAWYIWVSYVQLAKHSLIETVETRNAPSFWKRNSDGVAVAAISALLGAVLGASLTKIADRVFPASSATPAPQIAAPKKGPGV